MGYAPEDTMPRGWVPQRGIPPAARTATTPDSLKKGASPCKRSEEADFAMSYELEMQDAMDMDKVCLPLSPWEKLQIDRCFNHFDRDHSHELDLEEGTQPHNATLHLFCACNARARAPPSQPAT